MCPGEHVCVKMFQGKKFEEKKNQVKGLREILQGGVLEGNVSG